jgi:hypothetical protein
VIILFSGLVSCQETKEVKKPDVYAIVPQQTTYIFRINKDSILTDNKVVMLNNFVSKSTQKYLNNLHYKTPFIINVLENNTKIKGFVAVGKTADVDSIFNGKKYEYENFPIFEEIINKQHFYATQIDGQTLVSNQKLFIENCIRQKSELNETMQSEIFKLGINTLDNNADVNMIVHLPKLHKDIFYDNALKITSKQWADWEFFDLIDDDKQVYSGMNLTKDSLKKFMANFAGVESFKHNSKQFVPYTASEIISFSFADYADFYDKYTSFFNNSEANQIKFDDKLLGLTGLSFFVENSNKALILSTENTEDFVGDNPIKEMTFGDITVYKCNDDELINKHFSKLIPSLSVNYFSVIDNYIILAESKSYLQKVLNDYQNHSTLTNNSAYQKLVSELPENFNMEIINSGINVSGHQYLSARTYNSDDGNIFVNFVLQSKDKNTHNNLIEQLLSYQFDDTPINEPQLVYNHKTKQNNIIYQNDKNEIVLVNMKAKVLWKTKVKGEVVGKIQQVDLFRNHKLQYTFVTPHYWYVIDRLGRIVEHFPEHFMQKITKGISVFDYDSNRKYRFGITQGNKFRLYNNEAKKVEGFKVKTDDDILFAPQHFRIGSKDFIVMQDVEGKLYILNRRGETRIKVDKSFKITNNNWGVYNKKFINIDDDNNIISIDLKGKIKSAKMDLGTHILSKINDETLSAVSGNKLLINKKVISLDLGEYTRPMIVKNRKEIYVFLSNQDNQKIYAFDKHGKSLKNFPIIGKQIIDMKINKSGKYILAYDNSNNLIVYKF